MLAAKSLGQMTTLLHILSQAETSDKMDQTDTLTAASSWQEKASHTNLKKLENFHTFAKSTPG